MSPVGCGVIVVSIEPAGSWRGSSATGPPLAGSLRLSFGLLHRRRLDYRFGRALHQRCEQVLTVRCRLLLLLALLQLGAVGPLETPRQSEFVLASKVVGIVPG